MSSRPWLCILLVPCAFIVMTASACSFQAVDLDSLPGGDDPVTVGDGGDPAGDGTGDDGDDGDEPPPTDADPCAGVLVEQTWTGTCAGTVVASAWDANQCATKKECRCSNGLRTIEGQCPPNCSPDCPMCAVGTVRQYGDGTCCGTCVTANAGCTSPPPSCLADTDCPAGQTCISSLGVCGTDTGNGITFGGAICPQNSCWGAYSYFDDQCCPSCIIDCGGTSCGIDACGGSSCYCREGLLCTDIACLCAY